MLKIKPGVRIAGVRAELALAAAVADSVFAAHGLDCVITSAVEGRHGRGSFHFNGLAMDLRRRDANEANNTEAIDSDLKDALGQDFDVVLERNHWHIEFQPKTGVNLF
ncbi:MAG: hypothetical protein ACE5EM_13175 [Sphingomonadales bacterium]